MTAEVRLHIRTMRSSIVRARVDERHVEFCEVCGETYDRTGRTVVPVCRLCSVEAQRQLRLAAA